jgi:nucleoside-diphosphate-sugar epimerase
LAAEVGGIGANMANPGRFFYANASMGINLVENARLFNVKKFVFVSTVCSYPKICNIPFSEKDIWNGYPEETNAPYGIAKKSIMVMLQGYKQQYGLNSCVLIPTNLYGPNDNFDDNSSHVIPALIKKMIVAKREFRDVVNCWGTGNATREFLYVKDAARAVVLGLMKIDNPEPINLGSGEEISIRDLVYKIKSIVEYEGDIKWETNKPDGQPRRLVDTNRAWERLNWSAATRFDDGLEETIQWYLSTKN